MGEQTICRKNEKGDFQGIEGDFTAEASVHKTVEKAIYVMRLYRTLLERLLNKTGVYRSQHQILMDIARFPEASQKDIAMRHHVSTATIAVTLKKLEKGGYIVREVDKTDNRFNTITITKKGQKIVEESRRIFRGVEQEMFRGFSVEEIQMLESYMARIEQNLLAAVPETKREE